MNYLREFSGHTAYESYRDGNKYIRPNVSTCLGDGHVHYNEAPVQKNVIIYTTSSKLAETDDSYVEGLHYNAFYPLTYSHTFSNGIGTITFNGNVTTIGDYAFFGGGITSITLPPGVTSLGSGCFQYCQNLVNITSLAANCPSKQSNTFSGIGSNGTLYIPVGSDYSSWMSDSNFSTWTKVEA